MKRVHLISLAIIVSAQLSRCWDTSFHFNPCYNIPMEERMPLSVDNLIAIVERYERMDQNTDAEDIANAILQRYRKNGVIFNDESSVQWSVYQDEEVSKQDLDDRLLKPSIIFEDDSFMPREECALHMMTSHSTDVYPHEGIDYSWENFNRRRRRSVVLPDGTDPAEHPVEFGVIQTNAGPVAGGLLLAGIMSYSTTRSYTVEDLLGSDNVEDYMPTEMKQKSLQQLYGATISGKLGQTALLTGKSSKLSTFEVGPIGIFGNCSACARIYSLEDTEYSYLSRAEIFGALDGLIIAKTMKGSSRTLSLSEALRMYYSRHGLLSSFIRACNRKDIFNKFESTFGDEIQEQALNYMFAYQHYFPEIKSLVDQNQDDFTVIESTFSEYLDPIYSTFTSFMSSYSYDDPGYFECSKLTSDDVQPETRLDLVVIFTPSGSTDDMQKQAEYIALTARAIGVGYHRSRMAVLNGRTERWVSPMTNYSNIADYACNYTTFLSYATGSSQDFIEILDKLTQLYFGIYEYIRADPDRTGKSSQVVLWNLPSSFEGNEDEMVRAWDTFNLTYPDVTFVFAGTKDTLLTPYFNDDHGNTDDMIFVDTSADDPEDIAYDIVSVINRAPRMFVYPACDTLNDEYNSYNEESHKYINYVSPNYTTYLRIPPQNFHFSEYVKLMFSEDNIHVCLSRTNKEPSDDDDAEETYCEDSPFEYTQYALCGRYIWQCEPIYIAFSGSSDSNEDCQDEACQTPNQIEFQMTHEGMVCGVGGLFPSPFLLAPLLLILSWSW